GRLAVDDIGGAAADDAKGPALDDDGGVLVDADAEQPRVVRHGAQQPPIAAALGEMLVDDQVADQAQARGHVQVADAVGLRTGALDQHGLAHHRGAGRGAGDDAARVVQFADASLDRGVADLAGDAQLVAAAEEDAAGAVEAGERPVLEALGPILDVELDQVVHAQRRESLAIGVEIALGLVRGDGGDDQAAALQPTGDLLEDDALALLVLVAADDDQGARLSHVAAPPPDLRARRRRRLSGGSRAPGARQPRPGWGSAPPSRRAAPCAGRPPPLLLPGERR